MELPTPHPRGRRGPSQATEAGGKDSADWRAMPPPEPRITVPGGKQSPHIPCGTRALPAGAQCICLLGCSSHLTMKPPPAQALGSSHDSTTCQLLDLGQVT